LFLDASLTEQADIWLTREIERSNGTGFVIAAVSVSNVSSEIRQGDE